MAFLAPSLADASFKNVAEEAWHIDGHWNCRVRNFQEKVLAWNANHFGNIFHRKRRLLARIEDCLAFVGRVTLAKSVLAALPTYTMQTMLLPTSICNKLEGMQRDVIWNSGNQRGWHSIAWEVIRKPLQHGGLGFKSLHDFNKALLMKIGWGLLNEPNAYWVQVLKNSNLGWNVQLLRSYLTEEVVLEILGYPHLQDGYGDDKFVWGGRRVEKLVRWCFPDVGWIKINVDGSVKSTSNHVGCGGVLRDHNGIWLGGFSFNIGSSSVLMAERRGIILALHIAWERGLLKVWIESDSLAAMDLINKGEFLKHPYAYVLNQINSWKSKPWELKFSHIVKECNSVADFLANKAHSMPLGLHMWVNPPWDCNNFLLGDRLSVFHCHSSLL
ncbi:Ribonuclease H domain [Sesbania bispinosa]|nr:Ribonuclease H domain [Sesbania bispinosa]